MAEGMGLVAFGDLSPARTAFFIPPGCFKPPAADWRKGWDWSPSATCLRLELRSHPTGISQAACGGLAEGVGFEPTVGLTQRSISSRVP